MPDMLIRDVPDDVHQELRRRADERGESMQAYVASLLAAHAAAGGLAAWLDSLAVLTPVDDAPSAADLLDDDTEERARDLAGA